MESGTIDCTHDFYLKYYHMLLASEAIEYDEFDFIALDEAGDLNPVTLEIFKLLPGRKKIMVGDPYQNIFTFNHTINCFEIMGDKGTSFPMSKSFRVDKVIADKIKNFCHKHIDANMEFEGTELEDKTIVTKAFIARSNASLIEKMIGLNKLGVQYGLTRKADLIFKIPLMVCALKTSGKVTMPEYSYLQADVKEFNNDPELRKVFKNKVLAYLADRYCDEVQLKSSIGAVLRYGVGGVIACYEEAKKHEKLRQNYTLGTSHSTKGLEFDEVEVATDLNNIVGKIINKAKEGSLLGTYDRAELNLYYVACSRAKKSLLNAAHLESSPPSGKQ